MTRGLKIQIPPFGTPILIIKHEKTDLLFLILLPFRWDFSLIRPIKSPRHRHRL